MRANAVGSETLEVLAARVSRSELASVGAVVNNLTAVLNSANSSALDLEKAVQVDPPLAARVLRTANSALYGMPRRIASIREAIVLMGFAKVRSLAVHAKVSECFAGGVEVGAYTRMGLWKHSVGVALCSRSIFRSELRQPGELAYTAGLLHDIGILVEEQFLPDRFRALLDGEADGGERLLREGDAIGYTHADVAAHLLRAWKLPDALVLPVAAHHRAGCPRGAEPKLFAAVRAADIVCSRLGTGCDPLPDADPGPALQNALGALGMEADSLRLLAETAAGELARMEAEGVLL